MTGVTIDQTALKQAVAAAVQAPSLHNSQPWRFRLRANVVEVLSDPDRVLAASDPTGWAMRITCGAATFNMRLAFATQGHPVDVRWQPSRTDPAAQAALTPAAPRPANPLEQKLYPRPRAATSPRSSTRPRSEAASRVGRRSGRVERPSRNGQCGPARPIRRGALCV